MIYDENMRMVLWDYVPNKDSKNDIIKAMKANLELIDHEVIKEFSFSINEPYVKKLLVRVHIKQVILTLFFLIL